MYVTIKLLGGVGWKYIFNQIINAILNLENDFLVRLLCPVAWYSHWKTWSIIYFNIQIFFGSLKYFFLMMWPTLVISTHLSTLPLLGGAADISDTAVVCCCLLLLFCCCCCCQLLLSAWPWLLAPHCVTGQCRAATTTTRSRTQDYSLATFMRCNVFWITTFGTILDL